MSLRTYDEVRPWAKSIAKYVGDGTMPPWHADEGFGPWKNDRSLNEIEKQTLVRWAKRGALEGAKSDLPVMPTFGDGDWQLGEPDYIIEFDRMDLEAGGRDQFHNFEVPTDFGEDRWLKAVEIRP